MAAFLGDIAFLAGIVVAAAGLFALHRATGDTRPALPRTAGILLLAAGICTAICTSFYYLKYHRAGDLDHAYPAAAAGAMPMMKMMHGDMKGDRQRQAATVPEASDEAASQSEDEHQSHHPDEADGGPR